MDNTFCSNERSVQLLISLLKQHNIKRVIVSPGATNITFVGSIQNDPFFEIYSSVDERSAAYIACGLAAETQEPVVLSCTGATASRNYIPALTEAYYRKLPILAVTSTQDTIKVGHMVPQVIDRSAPLNDIVVSSELIPITKDEDSEWSNTIKINNAILALSHHGGGPSHINLTTHYSRDFSVKEYKEARKITRILDDSDAKFPALPAGRIAIFIGNHKQLTAEATISIDTFCHKNNAIVICDHTSGYKGKYKAPISILTSQEKYFCFESQVDLLIHIGEISGGYISIFPKEVWRVNEDGVIRDYFRKLSTVFEMPELTFFQHYSEDERDTSDSYIRTCTSILENCWNKIPIEIPFSNVWIAREMAKRMPTNATLHLGILNTLRSWNLFDIPNDTAVYCNTGGFGIDGCVSSLIGASLANPNKLYYGIVGDLAFFYDMNSMGNHHIGNNLRLMIINNGRGTEFRNYRHDGAIFGDDADKFIAAAGHYGNKSTNLIRHYAEDLGYKYMSASTKEEFIMNIDTFIERGSMSKSMVFEVFTDSKDESDALKIICTTLEDKKVMLKSKVRSLLGESISNVVRKVINK